MTVNSRANNDIHIYRYSSTLYDGKIKTLTLQGKIPDGKEAMIQVELDANDTGTLYLNGLPTPETLTFTASKSNESVNLYTSLTGVTATTIAGTMTIKMVDESGADITNLQYLRTKSGHFKPFGNKERLRFAGRESDYSAMLYVAWEIDIRNGDIVTIDSDTLQYRVSDCVNIRDNSGNPSHKEIMLKE